MSVRRIPRGGFELAAALVLCSVAAAQGPHIFVHQTRPSTGRSSQPSDLAVRQLNADQNPDVLVADRNNNQVQVWTGDVRGGLSWVRTYNVGNYPADLAVADIDGDKDLDAVTANYFGNGMSVLLGNGAAAFTVSPQIVTGPRPSDVALGDVDKDGLVDAIVPLETLGRLSVLLGDGKGGFSLQSARPLVGVKPSQALLPGDLNGDGNPDAVVVNAGDGTAAGDIVVLLGDGKGGFTAGSRQALQVSCTHVVSVDWNGDKILDYAVSNRASNSISIVLGVAGGKLGAPTHLDVGKWPAGLSVTDLDFDGKLDLLITESGVNRLRVLLGDGKGGFDTKTERLAATGTNPNAVGTGDLDNDGLPDAVVANMGDSTISVERNDPIKANRVFNIQIQPGSYSNGVFNPSAPYWDCLSSCPDWNRGYGWALGVTDPVPGAQLKNASNSSIDLPAGRYWLYGDPLTPNSALRVHVGWFSGVYDNAVFAVRCPEEKVPALWRLAGSRKIELGTPGIKDQNRVYRCNLGGGSSPVDYVFDINIHTNEQPQKPTADWISKFQIAPGTYDFKAKQFTASGQYWDTSSSCPDWNRGYGWALRVTDAKAGQPSLNCWGSNVTLAPDNSYYLYADKGISLTGYWHVRFIVDWSSGKRDIAYFATQCSEGGDAPRFIRVAGSPRLELGEMGSIQADFVNRCNFGGNGTRDHVFKATIHKTAPPPGKQEDRVQRIYIEPGSFSTQVFRGTGAYWDTVASCPDWNRGIGWTATLTEQKIGAPFLNCGNTRVTVATGNYFAYLDGGISWSSAVRVTLDWVLEGRKSAVFKVGAFDKASQWTRLAGSPDVQLWSTGLVNKFDRLNRCNYGANGTWDHVMDLRLVSDRWAPFGLGCKGSNGTPSISAKSKLAVGKRFELDLADMKPNAAAIVALGSSCETWGALQLPFDLSPFGATDCKVYTNVEFSFRVLTDGQGKAVWGVPIPLDGALVGAQIFQQAFVLDGANRLGIVASQAGGGRISR